MSHRPERAPSQRPLRVGEEIRHALADIFERGEVRDPELSQVSVTVTEVRMSPDLRQASVFIMPLGGRDEGAVLAALARAKGFLKGRVAGRVRLKYMPEFTFRRDETFERASRIAELIERTRAADAERGIGEGDDDAAGTEGGRRA